MCGLTGSPQELDAHDVVRQVEEHNEEPHGARLAVLRDAQPRHGHGGGVEVPRVKAHDVEGLALAEEHERALRVPEVVDRLDPVARALRHEAVRDRGPPEPDVAPPVTTCVHVGHLIRIALPPVPAALTTARYDVCFAPLMLYGGE